MISQRALKMGVKVPESKYDFWCERDIRGTNGTKREKYGEKYSGVNAAIVFFLTKYRSEVRGSLLSSIVTDRGCFSIASKAAAEPLFQAYYVIECRRSTVPISSILGNLPSPAYFVWRNIESAHE